MRRNDCIAAKSGDVVSNGEIIPFGIWCDLKCATKPNRALK
jgi:hypothetical protein